MRAALLLAVCISMYAAPVYASTYTIDIGSPIDELFIRTGWFPPEGPYMQFSEICKSRFRWTMPDAQIIIPVFPGVRNTITMRCDFAQTTGQRMICLIDDKIVVELSPNKDGGLLYSFDIKPEMVGSKTWVEMRIQTALNVPSVPGDGRDLRVIFDWIKISADAPERNFVAEALTGRASDFAGMTIDDVPSLWKMRYDPIDCGERFAPMSFVDMMYDDSGFEKVSVTDTPTMRKGDAVWYRTWIIINEKADQVRKRFILPGKSLAADGRLKVWLNGSTVEGTDYKSLTANTAKGLAVGANLIVVKAMKGPFPMVTGDDIIEQPNYTGEWSPDRVIFKLDKIYLKPSNAEVKKLDIQLIAPNGDQVGSWVCDVTNNAKDVKANISCMLNVYGEYRLYIDDNQGRTQSFPVHYLGITFFHWGWYPAGGGTTWNGFAPCSNEFLDQLFSKLDDWGKPHHAITWGGAILEPGTGFHLTKGTDYIAIQKKLIADGKLGFVGTMFPPRNIDTDSGEAAVRSMRRSRALYESQMGTAPTAFYSHDATLTPLLPQLMQMSGYDTFCISENWWGQGASIPNSRDCYWKNEDGSVIRVMDSWYHGLSPIDQARRAVELGKPAVLCNEEFACLDMTVFLTKDDAAKLANEGIFVQPVSLDEYRKITDDYARKFTYKGDANLCYKGWTGGGEGEFEFEKANRGLEAKLVALENLIAFAKWLGIETDDKRVDEFWNLSLRANECHLHWGNGIPSLTASLLDYATQATGMMSSLASSINSRIKATNPGVTIFNPLGMRRSTLVRVKASPEFGAITALGKMHSLQADPDQPGMLIAAPGNLPSCGYRRYDLVAGKPEASRVSAIRSGSTV
ncbi:MAG: glycoside hydrolase family 38 N-terminal domain-containing protein, partial [Armatimonadota bacterium]